MLSNIWPSWSIGTHLGGIGHFLRSHAGTAHTSAFAEKRTGSMALPAVFLVQIVCLAGRKYNVCSGCWQDGTPQQRNYLQMQMWSLGTGTLALIYRFLRFLLSALNCLQCILSIPHCVTVHVVVRRQLCCSE
jgi:hypothetical protein